MSIFNLKTDVRELSGDQGITRGSYEQVTASRDPVDDAFSSGSINFRWEVSGQKWWIPKDSYLRKRIKLTKPDGLTPLELSDNVAPNMLLASTLYQSEEYRMNDKTLSRNSDYVAQVAALERRLMKSRAWLNGIGKSAELLQPDFRERQSVVVSDDSNAYEAYTVTNRNDLPGVDPLNQIAIALDSGVMTITANGGAAPNLLLSFRPGDEIEIYSTDINDNPGTIFSRCFVSEVAAGQLTLGNYKTLALGSNTYKFNRIRRISLTSDDTRGVSEFELVYTPSLSIFKIDHAIPTSRNELILNPASKSKYQTNAVETALGVAAKTADIDFKLTIKSCYLYIRTVEGARQDNITYLLDLEQTRCQTYNVSGAGFSQRAFDISPSSYAITVAFQDRRAGSDSRISLTKFKAYNNAVDAGTENEQDLKLERFFFNYSGVNRPAPDSNPEFDISKDHTTQRYVESMINSGAYDDAGGGESIEEFHRRGPYYFFKTPTDGTDRSTRLTVHSQFDGTADVSQTRILLFDHSKQVARVRIQDGRVVDVQVEDV